MKQKLKKKKKFTRTKPTSENGTKKPLACLKSRRIISERGQSQQIKLNEWEPNSPNNQHHLDTYYLIIKIMCAVWERKLNLPHWIPSTEGGPTEECRLQYPGPGSVSSLHLLWQQLWAGVYHHPDSWCWQVQDTVVQASAASRRYLTAEYLRIFFLKWFVWISYGQMWPELLERGFRVLVS